MQSLFFLPEDVVNRLKFKRPRRKNSKTRHGANSEFVTHCLATENNSHLREKRGIGRQIQTV